MYICRMYANPDVCMNLQYVLVLILSPPFSSAPRPPVFSLLGRLQADSC